MNNFSNKSNKKISVLIIAQYFPPDMGGSSSRAYNVAKGMAKLGHNVNVITAFPHYPNGYVVTNLHRKAFYKTHAGISN